MVELKLKLKLKRFVNHLVSNESVKFVYVTIRENISVFAIWLHTDCSKIPGRSKHFDGKISDVRKLKLRYLSIDFFWPNLGQKKTNLALKWQIFERNCKNMLICIFLHSFYTNFNHIKVLSTLNLQNSMFSIFWHFLTRSKSSPKKGSMQSMYENMVSNLPGHINFWAFAEKSKKKALFYRKIS